MPTLMNGDAGDGETPASLPQLDAHESRMLKAFGAAWMMHRTKSESQLSSELAIARIMALKAGIKEMNDRANETLKSCQSLMDACGEAIAAWFKGLSGAALKRAIKEVRSCGRNGLRIF